MSNMPKSSLKTFLAGKNKYNGSCARLEDTNFLSSVVSELVNDCTELNDNGTYLNIDVLDDGTAITYITR